MHTCKPCTRSSASAHAARSQHRRFCWSGRKACHPKDDCDTARTGVGASLSFGRQNLGLLLTRPGSHKRYLLPVAIAFRVIRLPLENRCLLDDETVAIEVVLNANRIGGAHI